jgi:hypothetical protein
MIIIMKGVKVVAEGAEARPVKEGERQGNEKEEAADRIRANLSIAT